MPDGLELPWPGEQKRRLWTKRRAGSFPEPAPARKLQSIKPLSEKLHTSDSVAARYQMESARISSVGTPRSCGETSTVTEVRAFMRGLERFRAKWISVRVKKTRQNRRLEPGSDSIRTDKALAKPVDQPCCCTPNFVPNHATSEISDRHGNASVQVSVQLLRFSPVLLRERSMPGYDRGYDRALCQSARKRHRRYRRPARSRSEQKTRYAWFW